MGFAEITDRMRVLLEAAVARSKGLITMHQYRQIVRLHELNGFL